LDGHAPKRAAAQPSAARRDCAHSAPIGRLTAALPAPLILRQARVRGLWAVWKAAAAAASATVIDARCSHRAQLGRQTPVTQTAPESAFSIRFPYARGHWHPTFEHQFSGRAWSRRSNLRIPALRTVCSRRAQSRPSGDVPRSVPVQSSAGFSCFGDGGASDSRIGPSARRSAQPSYFTHPIRSSLRSSAGAAVGR
jgi:hypothetical protein